MVAVDVRAGANAGINNSSAVNEDLSSDVRKVEFYQDINGNSVFDPKQDLFLGIGRRMSPTYRPDSDPGLAEYELQLRIGDPDDPASYSWQLPVVSWSPGSHKFFAIAQDYNDQWSEEAGARHATRNLGPKATRLDDTPDPVTEGNEVTLTAVGVRDEYGEVHSVAFYRESNGSAGLQTGEDQLLSVDQSGGDGWEWAGLVTWNPGDHTYYALVTDNYGAQKQVQTDGVVNDRPEIGTFTDNPDPVKQTGELTLTVSDITDSDSPIGGLGDTIENVEFYRDSNSNGSLEVGTDDKLDADLVSGGDLGPWTWQGPATWGIGDHIYFARALDSDGGWSVPVAVGGRVENARPTINALVDDPDPVTTGYDLTLVAQGVLDANGTIQKVEFYRDADGDGSLGPAADEFLGAVLTSETDDYSLTTPVDWSAGTQMYFARALDDNATWSETAAAQGFTNGRPAIDELLADPSPLTPGEPLTLTASGVSDTDGTVQRVAFYRDSNADGVFQATRDELIATDEGGTDGWETTFVDGTDVNLFFARAQDDKGGWSFPKQVNVLRRPVVTALSDFPDPVNEGADLLLQASDVLDVDGSVDAVEFFRDDGDGVFEPGADASLGLDTTGGDGWKLTVPATWAGGEHIYFARARDDSGVWNLPEFSPSTTGAVNLRPSVDDLTAAPPVVTRGETITLTASGVSDPAQAGVPGIVPGVEEVEFYRDDGDGTFDPGADILLSRDTDGSDGWGVTTSTGGWAALEHTFFVRAADGNGAWSDANSTTGIVNARPVVGALDDSPDPVNEGDDLTLTALGVSDPEGRMGRVDFYRDVNDNDTFDGEDRATGLLASDAEGADGWSVTVPASWNWGTYSYFAVPVDDPPSPGVPAEGEPISTTGVVNSLPTVASLTPDPGTVTRGSDLLDLTAGGVSDADSDPVTQVEFYVDGNADGSFDPAADTLLGTDGIPDAPGQFSVTGLDTSGLPGGNVVFFARATDGKGWGPAQSTTVTVVNNPPTVGGLSASPDPVRHDAILTLTATGVSDPDGDPITRAEFYHDVNGDGSIDGGDALVGSDADPTGGWSAGFGVLSLPLGDEDFLARVRDADDWSDPVGTTVTIQNALPTVGTVDVTPDPISPGDQVTVTAAGVTDPDGSVTEVRFYHDSDQGGAWDSGDELLGTDDDGTDGWSTTSLTAGWGFGTQTVFARAVDDAVPTGEVGPATSGTVEVALSLIESRELFGNTTVTFYDVDTTNGISDPDIAWGWGEFQRGVTDIVVDDRLTGVKRFAGIRFFGDGAQTRDIGVAVDGRNGISNFLDQRPMRASAPPLAFLAVQGEVGRVSLPNGVTGSILGGLSTPGGWTLPRDLDDDGATADRTAVYAGSLNAAILNTTAGGDVVSSWDLGFVRSNVAMQGAAAGHDLGTVVALGDIAGPVIAGRNVGAVRALGGDITGGVTAGGNLNAAVAVTSGGTGGAVTGDVSVGGDMGVLVATNGDVSGNVNVSGNASSIRAVNGSISDGDSDGNTVSVGGNLAALIAFGPGGGDGDVEGLVDVGGSLNAVRAVGGDIGALQVGTDLGVAVAVNRAGEGGSIGAVNVGRNAGAVRAVGGNLTDTVDVDGRLNAAVAVSASPGGNISGDLSAGGGLGAILATGDLTGDVSVSGGHLGRVTVRGNMSGSALEATDRLAALFVGGRLEDSVLRVGDVFGAAAVVGDFHNSSIDADRLGRVVVRGQIAEDPADGEDVIRARNGRFFARDLDDVAMVAPGEDALFDGLRAFVG